MEKKKDWLAEKLKSESFRKLLAQEEFIESFLDDVDFIMKKKKISRTRLAKKMGCKPSDITQIMRRTRKLTAEMMVDIAYNLGAFLQLNLVPLEFHDIFGSVFEIQTSETTETPTEV